MLLQDHQLDKDVKKALAIIFCVNTANKAINNTVDKTVDANEENEEIINIKEFLTNFHKLITLSPLLRSKLYPSLPEIKKVKLTRLGNC